MTKFIKFIKEKIAGVFALFGASFFFLSVYTHREIYMCIAFFFIICTGISLIIEQHQMTHTQKQRQKECKQMLKEKASKHVSITNLPSYVNCPVLNAPILIGVYNALINEVISGYIKFDDATENVTLSISTANDSYEINLGNNYSRIYDDLFS